MCPSRSKLILKIFYSRFRMLTLWWILQIYIYLVARRDVLRFEMSHRQKITATVRDQISASSGPSRKEVRGGSWLFHISRNLWEAVLMNKHVDESHGVYRCSGSLIFLFIKGILSHWIRFGAWIKKFRVLLFFS